MFWFSHQTLECLVNINWYYVIIAESHTRRKRASGGEPHAEDFGKEHSYEAAKMIYNSTKANHILHYCSIAILAVFVVEVGSSPSYMGVCHDTFVKLPNVDERYVQLRLTSWQWKLSSDCTSCYFTDKKFAKYLFCYSLHFGRIHNDHLHKDFRISSRLVMVWVRR